MGAAASALDFNGKSVNSIVEKLMPLYYQKDPVTAEDIYLAENSWRVIIEGSSPQMHEMRQTTGLHEADGMDLYKELFFSRLFDVHEAARPLFSEKAIRSGKFIGAIFQLCFKQLENPKEFRQEMVAVAQAHCQWGIRTVEYGIIGDVLFWSLHRILGEAYTRRVEEAWTRTFSSMLRVIVPIAVAFERDDGKFKKALAARAQRAASFKQSQSPSGDSGLLTSELVHIYFFLLVTCSRD